MFQSIMSLLAEAYTAVFDWFNDFVGSIPGMLQFVFAMIAISIIYRFVLSPVFTSLPNFHSVSGLGSDRVKREFNNEVNGRDK